MYLFMTSIGAQPEDSHSIYKIYTETRNLSSGKCAIHLPLKEVEDFLLGDVKHKEKSLSIPME